MVDFAHQPNYQPVAKVGLGFVGMSRSTDYAAQGFRNLPDFWAFRKVLKDQIFKWRRQAEEDMDKLHDDTMAMILGRSIDVEEDVRMHSAWSQEAKKRALTQEEVDDLREMLQVRGLRKPPEYYYYIVLVLVIVAVVVVSSR